MPVWKLLWGYAFKPVVVELKIRGKSGATGPVARFPARLSSTVRNHETAGDP